MPDHTDTDRNDILFSVVIAHYAKTELWKQAVDSVLMQNYPAIEIVFADDGSPGFNCAEVEEYIRARAGENIVAVHVFQNETNCGTVENCRRAHQLCTGKYLTHIAADDAYIADDVLSHYRTHLDAKPADVLGVYGQSHLCKSKLVRINITYFIEQDALEMNDYSADEQFHKLAYRCCIPMGATAFVREEFLPYETPEGYRLIEDWPFFVRATKAGKRFLFGLFDALLYRDGGITRAETPTQRQCYIDTLHLYEHEILPGIDRFPMPDQLKVYWRYNQERIDISRRYGELSDRSRVQILWRNKPLMLRLLLEYLKRARVFSLCALLWLIGLIVLLVLGRTFTDFLWMTSAVFSLFALVSFFKSALANIKFLFFKRRK